MSQTCSVCQGQKLVSGPNWTQVCPTCEGTGQEYDPGREFTYELGPIVLLGGQTLQSQSVQVLTHSFRWMMALATSTFPFTCQIADSRDLRPFSNQPVHSANLFGTAQNPMPLLTPFIFPKQSNILTTVTDLGGAQMQVSVTNGSPSIVYVSGAPFVTGAAWVNQTIVINGVSYTISGVSSQTLLTLGGNYAGVTSAGTPANVGNSVRLAFKGVELSD